MSMRLFQWAGALVVATLVATAGRVEAEIVVSNLSEPAIGVDGTGPLWGAQSFMTGGSALTLQSVTLRLLNGYGQVDVFLYGDDSGEPGSSLLSLGSLDPSESTPLDQFADYTLTASSSLALAANTAYWVVAQFHDGRPSWAYTNSENFSGSGMLGDYAAVFPEEEEEAPGAGPSLQNGLSWRVFDDAFPYQMSVNATSGVVPEPSSLVLMAGGLSLAALGLAGRRKATA